MKHMNEVGRQNAESF